MKISDFKEVDGFIKTSHGLETIWSKITIDSRRLDGHNVFLSLKGDSFDGHNFIEAVIEKKVKNIILHDSRAYEDYILKYPEVTFILVKDTLSFLQQSATYRMQAFKEKGHRCLAITGSNGKTTSKEMIYHIAKSFSDNVACTQGNLNNLIGVPLTIHQQVDELTDFAIIEMGTGKPGDIDLLSNMARPRYGFVTSIGLAHIEFLEDIDGVFKEKTSLYRRILNDGELFYINMSDIKLKDLIGKKATVECADLKINNQAIKESYNKENLNCAAFIVGHIFNDMTKAKLVAENFEMPKMNRSQRIKLNEKELYLDAYNANPSSMAKALESFSKNVSLNDSIFVLGDMNELGHMTEAEHKKIGVLLNSLGIKRAIFIGHYREFYNNGFNGDATCYETVDDFLAEAKNVLNSYKYVFLKASRSLQLERILDIKDRL